MPSKRLLLLETVARGFGDLVKNVVFVGGATLDLYVDEHAALQSRTRGIQDCILGSLALPDYAMWQNWLVERGFEKRESLDRFRYRWVYEGHTLQILAQNKDSLGFDYRWFDEGIFHASRYELPNGMQIKAFSPVYFIAAKIESFVRTSGGDFRMSEDFEDIVFVLENRPEIGREMVSAFHEVRQYIQQHFQRFLLSPLLEEGLYNVLPHDVHEAHIQGILQLMQEVVDFKPHQNYNRRFAS